MANLIRKASNRSVDFIYDGFAGYDDVAEFDYEDHAVLVHFEEELGDTDIETMNEWGFDEKDKGDFFRESLGYRVELANIHLENCNFEAYEREMNEIEEEFGVKLNRAF